MARFVKVDKRVPGVRYHPRRKPVFDQNLLKISDNPDNSKTTYKVANMTAIVHKDYRGELTRVVVYG